jgi:hypothetical protein
LDLKTYCTVDTNYIEMLIRQPLDQMILVMAGAWLCERRPNLRATFSYDAHMRVGKQLLAAKKPNQ